jgi:hypothetical protein
MDKLTLYVLDVIKAILNKEISLEEVSKYPDIVTILNAVAIECCGVSVFSKYPLVSLVVEGGKVPALQEINCVLNGLVNLKD